MNAKQAANQLRGLLDTSYLESNGELVEMVRDIVKFLNGQDALLERTADMLQYVELLGRALTPNEVKKVHALLVEIKRECANLDEKDRASDPEAYHQFLEDTAGNAEYNAWLDHIHTPSASEY